MVLRNIFFLFALFLITRNVFSVTYFVSNEQELKSSLKKAKENDSILLQEGKYVDVNLSVKKNGLTIMALKSGSVHFCGKTKFIINGDDVYFSGFQFIDGESKGTVIEVNGNRCELSELNFSGFLAKKYISLNGQQDVLKNCNFENKPVNAYKGNLVHIGTRKDNLPNKALIQYCSFKNIPGEAGDFGNECIRITNGEPATYKANAIIEYCYFTNTGDGDSEAISVKSEENILRFNTM